MGDTRLVTEGPRPSVRLERQLPDPPPAVWRALTDRQELEAWFPCDVAVDGGRWEVGAAITFIFPKDVIDVTLTGRVLIVDEPHRLSYTWGEETLTFELSPAGSGTLLVLYDELERDAAARNAAGWEDCLDRLADVESAPDGWRAHFESYRTAFEPLLGPQSGPPPGYQG